jgi:hypothetical protein
MIEYLVDDHRYAFSYQELREKYIEFCRLPDNEFLLRLPEAAHLACIICFIKETGYWAVSDRGIVHELIHLMHIPEGNTATLYDIRELFKKSLELA